MTEPVLEIHDDFELDTPDVTAELFAKFEQDMKSYAKNAVKQANAYTDNRIAQVNEKIVLQENRIQAIETALGNGFSVPQPNAQCGTNPQQAESRPNIIDSTLGTVGGVLHGVVDTAAFILESAVDLVTFGRAKQYRHPQ